MVLIKEFQYNASGQVTLDYNIDDFKYLILGTVANNQYFNPTMLPTPLFKILTLNSEYVDLNTKRHIAQLHYINNNTVNTDFYNMDNGCTVRLYGVK